jgi:hypothetical protein
MPTARVPHITDDCLDAEGEGLVRFSEVCVTLGGTLSPNAANSVS